MTAKIPRILFSVMYLSGFYFCILEVFKDFGFPRSIQISDIFSFASERFCAPI